MSEGQIVLADLSQRVLDPDFEWTAFRPGVDIHRLYGDAQSGPAAALLHYEAGAAIPYHRHQGYEHIFILHGTQVDHRGTHRAGTLVVNSPGTGHEVRSPDGCVVLVIWERRVDFPACAG